MVSHCHSCGGQLEVIGVNSKNSDLCQYCGDKDGNLLPREAVEAGIAQWLKSWAPVTDGVDFVKRAKDYMASMPSWN